MLKKVLFQNQDKTQLTIAVLGSIIGMLFLISSIHYLIRVNEFGKGEEILGPNTMIVQKKVSNSSSFNLTKTDFSVNEIERFKNEPFVADAQAVICNNFNVLLLTDDKFVPKFSSDVFLQTVNSKFLDVPADKWNWNEGDTIVPIVMPRDFLVMLNTFMSASGIPQVSEDLAKDIKFKLRISNEIKKDFVTAKIVGFTNEIPSLLVPETFMKYANQKYATVKETKITNVMISSKEGEFGKMEKFLEERGLESRKSQVVIGKLKSIVSTLFVVLLLISFVTVLVSSLVLIQYMQLLIATNQYQIRTLLRLGYNPRKIILLFTKYLGFTFGIVSILALAMFLLEKILIDNLLEKGGITIGHSISPISMVSVFISFCIFVFISYLVARRKIMNEFFS
jgi:ABC-type antimicrobial peptide transport system permease subunit